jgi:ATP-binding cassette, subfamily C, bacterial
MEYMKKDVAELVRHFLKAYPKRSALIIALSIFAGFAEGVGIASLLPLLEVTAGGTDGDSPLMQMVRTGLAVVGLEPTMGVLLVLLVGGMFLKGGFLWLAARQVGYTVAHVATDLRLTLIRALMRARWGYFVSQQAGHVSNAIGLEASRASTAYSAACALLAVTVQAVIYTVAAFLISPIVALVALLAGSLLAILFVRLVRMSRNAGRRQTLLVKSLSARLVDALGGLKPMKAMAQEVQLQPLLEAETRDLNEAQRRQVMATGIMTAFHEPLLILILAVGLYVTLTVTDVPLSGLLVMMFLFHRLVGRIHEMQMKYQTLVIAESAFWSLHDAVDLAESEREVSGARLAPPPLTRGVRLDAVDFSYTSRPMLRGISLNIPAGSFVALVGPSGVGKTTIIDLVTGLYRPTRGEIYVDDVPLSDVDLRAWRRQIGYVPQEMLLFHDTIHRNVTLGDDTIDPHAVDDALQAAGASEFMSELPDGVNTIIGERGARLSGGQRQRIAIARALVRKPRLLVLDEVTTALDPATEAEICATLRKLAGRVTVLAISHQAAMTEVADIVYRLDDGVVQQVTELAAH